jgi:hypothetical protein
MQFVVVHLAAVSPFEPRAPNRRDPPRHCGGSSRVRRGRRFWLGIIKPRFLVAPEKLAYFLDVRSFWSGACPAIPSRRPKSICHG